MYAVILAGGGGTRLWPLSRPDLPKPFLPLIADRTLLEMTVDRLVGHPELGLAPADITVVTDRRYQALVAAQLPAIRILAEPIGRNTAPAIALATVAIERPEDEVMIVLPADHAIERPWVLRAVLAAAARLAGGAFGVAAPLVTVGIQVDRPATEYGYLLPDLGRGEHLYGQRAYPLLAFEEKPNVARAEELLE
jgi:mannose-1-phosphate guanylyltransferase